MNLRAASLIFAFAVAAFPTQAQGPGGGPPTESLANQMAVLTAQVINLQGRVAKLEGQITASDLVGTYAVHAFYNELIAQDPGNPPPGGPPTLVSSSVQVGTAVLAIAADGTSTISFNTTTKGNALYIGPPASLNPFQNAAGGVTTWTYANGTLTFQGGGGPVPLSVAAGGRVLVHASTSDINSVLLILTRLL